MKYLFLVFLTVCTNALFVQGQSLTSEKENSVCMNTNERKLYNLVMEYRKQNNLPSIPLSTSLTFVAQTHCKDLVNNRPNVNGCNMHSWSNKGKWTPCCYTPDHKQAINMWNKPSELTPYKSYGYEIAFYVWHSDNPNYTATPEEALEGWKSSEGHNSVIINKSIWKSTKWNAIGIGIYKGFATIWFGEKIDVAGEPQLCN